MASLREVFVEPLPRDALTLAQAMAIDAGVFPFPSRLFERAAFDDAVRVWVAREEPGGRPIGVLAAYVIGVALQVHGVAVERAHRRSGVGRALLRAAIDGAPRGVREIVLQVSTTNAAAIALYKSEGFRARRRRPAYYTAGIYPGSGDAIEMVRSVR